MYADFEFYQNSYKGTKITDEDTYNFVSLKAVAIINQKTLGRASNIDPTDDVYTNLQYCQCELVDYINENSYQSGNIASETVGSYSVSYTDNNSFSNNINAILSLWLTQEMLFKGLGRVCT